MPLHNFYFIEIHTSKMQNRFECLVLANACPLHPFYNSIETTHFLSTIMKLNGNPCYRRCKHTACERKVAHMDWTREALPMYQALTYFKAN